MTYDVAIVGGGPAGLAAALLLARSRRRVIVIDDGQPRNSAAQHLHGYLGHDGIEPAKLLERGRAEVAHYNVEFLPGTVVSATESQDRGKFPTEFHLEVTPGQNISARKLLLATGVVDTLPDVPGLKECFGRSMHHCPYCDGWEHRDQALATFGSEPEDAVGLALALRTWSSNVTALTNGTPLKDVQRLKLEQNRVAARVQPVVRAHHHNGQLRSIEFVDGTRLSLEALFFNLGHCQRSDIVRQLGAARDGDEHASTSDRQKAAKRGLFVAGDADGDVQFAIVAAAEGATSAVAINRELQDEDQK
jgi:thioredoxin reductase